MALRPIDEELWIERDPAGGVGIELDHPAVDALRVELRIDGAVKRVGEINATAIAADLDHLRSASELAVLRRRVARARDDSADAYFAGQLWIERVRYVVLLQIAGAPASHVEQAIVHRQIDIRDERRNSFEALEH